MACDVASENGCPYRSIVMVAVECLTVSGFVLGSIHRGTQCTVDSDSAGARERELPRSAGSPGSLGA